VPEADSAASLKLLLVWMEEHLSHQHSVDCWRRRRTFRRALCADASNRRSAPHR
jgi:hypothetical protein